MDLFELKETDEYYPLSVLFHESGMEIEVSDIPPEGMVKMWRLEDKETGEVIAAVTLQIRDHVYTPGDLAVRVIAGFDRVGPDYAAARASAVTWLMGAADEQIGFALRNMTGNITGMLCDEGKAGCALKLVTVSQEECIADIAGIGADGMRHMDKAILSIMKNKKNWEESK
ncbi:MAG: L-serine ammonia-lyase, iron-sulfur-dependent, subunit alpha [Eubacteriales bacterium]|nr:L-serine ammonia-lyase, iron-sulfur-dependent, subunit alpha [Eubacteriales bacterium]